MNHLEDIKVILFDLGGVLIDFVGLREVKQFMPGDPSPLEVRSKWVNSKAIAGFEAGKLNKHEFIDIFREEWEISMRSEEFEQMFVSWIKGPLPGMEELLADLRDDFQLACLSNTSQLHWDFMLDEVGLSRLLDNHYASHEIGMIKPDRRIYDFVSTDLQVDPSQILFFDDGKENVEGAIGAGMKAFQVDGPATIREKLQTASLLPKS